VERLQEINIDPIDCESVNLGKRICVATFEEVLEEVFTVVKRVKRTIPVEELEEYEETTRIEDPGEEEEEVISDPGMCNQNYTVVHGDTCAIIYRTHNMTEHVFKDLNSEVCCGKLRTNATICVQGIPPSPAHLTAMYSLKNDEQSTAFCPYEFRNASMPSNGTFFSTPAPPTPVVVNLASPTPESRVDGETARGGGSDILGGGGDPDEEPEEEREDVETPDVEYEIPFSEPRGSGLYSPADYEYYHNQCRARDGSPPIGWSDYYAEYVHLFLTLSREAQEYADQLAYRCSSQLVHSGVFGENLWMGSPDAFNPPSSSINEWCYKEPTYGDPTFVNKNHRTQVAEYFATLFGCGLAACQRWEYLVCRYDVSH
jgi:hypothetical protein